MAAAVAVVRMPEIVSLRRFLARLKPSPLAQAAPLVLQFQQVRQMAMLAAMVAVLALATGSAALVALVGVAAWLLGEGLQTAEMVECLEVQPPTLLFPTIWDML